MISGIQWDRMILQILESLSQQGLEYSVKEWKLKHELMKSLCNDREQWWAAKAKQMDGPTEIRNARHLFRLIKGRIQQLT